MNKQEAIQWLGEITNGKFDRHSLYHEIPKGTHAVYLWDRCSEFGYGMEYGAILAIMEIFDLTKEDLENG